jgi:ABC-type transport system involved in multi-copper enzyme maturation permease subunit
MMSRVARLVRAEALKLSSHPFLYAALGILAAATLLSASLGPRFSGFAETEWRSANSWQLLAYGFKFGLKIATFVLVIFSSMMFAGEFDRGTIKNLLTRPISRTDLFVAKGVTVGALAVLLWLFVLYVALVYALGRGELGAVWDDLVYEVRRDPAEIAAHGRKALLMTFVPFLAAGFLGLLVSTWTESSGYAVAIALVLYLFGDVVTGMMAERAQQKVFLYYAPYALDKLRLYAEGTNTTWNADVDRGRLFLTVPLAYAAAFIPAAYGLFRAKNIHA